MSKIYIDGTEVDLDIRRPGVGSVVSAYGTGRRVILTVPTFEKFHQGTPKKFARLMASQTSPWHCVAVSLDYPPILSQWATITGWEGQPFKHLLGDDPLGVFSQKLGILVPAIFIIDSEDHILYCEFPQALDRMVNFETAEKFVVQFVT